MTNPNQNKTGKELVAVGASIAVVISLLSIPTAPMAELFALGLAAAKVALGGVVWIGVRSLWPKEFDLSDRGSGEEVSIDELLERLNDLCEIGDRDIRTLEVKIAEMTKKIVAYFKNHSDQASSWVEAEVYLRQYVVYAIRALDRYKRLPRKDSASTSQLKDQLGTILSSAKTLYDKLCQDDEEAFHASLEIEKKTIESLSRGTAPN